MIVFIVLHTEFRFASQKPHLIPHKRNCCRKSHLGNLFPISLNFHNDIFQPISKCNLEQTSFPALTNSSQNWEQTITSKLFFLVEKQQHCIKQFCLKMFWFAISDNLETVPQEKKTRKATEYPTLSKRDRR